MGFEFGFVVQWVVLGDQDVAGKTIESLLTGAVEFLGRTVGGPASGKVSEWAHEIAACLNTP
jgi:hypothetical protein